METISPSELRKETDIVELHGLSAPTHVEDLIETGVRLGQSHRLKGTWPKHLILGSRRYAELHAWIQSIHGESDGVTEFGGMKVVKVLDDPEYLAVGTINSAQP